ncbi:MAG TPA: FG-GAP-like repeat-containing protein [Candidatus Polarisedimenticolaceae bacterium]|nr:FG-GAP-like repeat-containing protein [Candidatus Polarisedimenticolaceae bacterium]
MTAHRVGVAAMVAGMSLSMTRAAAPDADWLAKVRDDIAQREYRFAAAGNGEYQAPNRAQGFRVAVGEGIVHVSPRIAPAGEAASPSLTWRTARWGRPGELQELRHLGAVEKDGGMRLELGPVVETLTNDMRGLEQGLEIAVPPPGPRQGRLVVESELTTDLLARPSQDGQMIQWLDASGKAVLWLTALSVKDALGVPLPARFEVGPRRLAIAIEDEDAVYPLTVDPLLTSPFWTNQSNQTNAHYGGGSTAGDVNGDGFSDILIAAPDYDNGQADEGRVFLYFGSPSGPPTAFSRAFESNQANAHFGSSVSAAGDLNGDGFDDFAIGARAYDDGQMDEGAVFVYTGSATAANIVRATTLEADQAGANFGWALAYGGDVDGDGYPELVVGAPSWDGGQLDEGAMFVYFGDPTSVIRAQAPFRAESDQAGAALGYSVAGGTDVNANGFADVFAGALNWDTATTVGAGRVLGFFGSANSLPASPSWIQDGVQGDFGESVACVGDTNGDGFAELVVGASWFSGTLSTEGRVYVYRGNAGGLFHSAQTFDGGVANLHLGFTVAPAGDVNGDGFADVAVGTSPAPGSNGEALVWFGSPTGLPTAPSWTYTGDQADAGTGRHIFTAGDVNGDGYSDLLVSASEYNTGAPDGGQAYVFLGSGDGLNATAQATLSQNDPTGNGLFALAMASAGDVNADGFSDVIVGAPYFHGEDGSAWIYLGSATGLSTTPQLELRGPQLSDAQFGYGATGVGDVNGDGFDDVAVGAPQFFFDPDHDAYQGRIFVYPGSSAGLSGTESFAFPESSGTILFDDRFGETICAAGDVNGDGLNDFYVAGDAPELFLGSRTTLTQGGSVASFGGDFTSSSCASGDVDRDGYSDMLIGQSGDFFGGVATFAAYLGGPAGLSGTASWNTASPPDTGNGFATVAQPSDFNGDAHLDVVTSNEEIGGHTATINVYFGSAAGPDETADQTFTVPSGVASMATGDVNGDGLSDLVIGSQDANGTTGLVAAGRVAVYLGSASGLSTTPAFTREGTAGSAHLGATVVGSLDVNGDGFSDIVIGEPYRQQGFAYVHLGGGGDGLDYIPLNFRGDNTAPVGLLGWSGSNDRFRIHSRGRSARGRSLVAMDHFVAPLGTRLFSGTLVRGSFFDTGTTDSAGADVNFNRLVSGLVTATPYTWAMQFRAKDPIFPHTRWITLPGNGREETDVRTACALVNWFRDVDGDSYGNAAVSLQACLQPAGYVAASGDCNDAQPAMFPGNPELCDGLDNDCAGGPDNGFVAPSGAPALATSKSGVTIGLSWPGLGGADRYDVVRGDLGTLRSSAGNFTSSTLACVANDSALLQTSDTTPAGSGGLWYLARGVNCNANGTYDDPASSQLPGRDAEIGASSSPCP